jgi:hypothetical protein
MQQRKSVKIPQENSGMNLEEDVSIHIFSVSAAMVGVCLTVIGIIRVVITIGNIQTLADNFLSLDALLFLFACILSYLSLRTRGIRRLFMLERIADGLFIIGLVLMGFVCVLIAYDLT